MWATVHDRLSDRLFDFNEKRNHILVAFLDGTKTKHPSLFMFRESSFNMTRRGDEDIEGGLRKFLDTQRGGSEKIVGLGGGEGRGSENLYTSKPTHDIIIQIGWFSTQQFNDLCNLAISRGLQI